MLIYINNIFAAGLFGSGSGKVAFSGNGPEVTHGSCNTYSDCGTISCIFYQRCCLHGKCFCGTSGRENQCK